jgi:arsenate reductase
VGASKRLFNTSGQSYRALGAAAVAAMDEAEALAALAADGKLIKRPLVFTARGDVLVGFKPQEWEAVLLA